MIRTDNTMVVLHINRQGRTCSLPLLKWSHSLLLWWSVHFPSLRAAHVPPESRGRSSLQEEMSCKGMKTASKDGCSDLGALRQGDDGPLYIQREHSLVSSLQHTSRDGCICLFTAFDSPVKLSSSGCDFACLGESAPAEFAPCWPAKPCWDLRQGVSAFLFTKRFYLLARGLPTNIVATIKNS